MYGNDYEYARSRLDNTVVRLVNGCPVLVNAVNMDGAHVTQLDGKGGENCVPLEALNLKPVPLGYVNMPNSKTAYICRAPKRNDWRQGMRHANIKVLGNAGIHREEVGYLYIGRCIEGNYPPYDKALVMSKKGSKAWCRDWAVHRASHLLNKGRVVGVIVEGKPVLNEDYEYLMESLEESYA
ncbi:hypothetical protein N9924_00650 [bacterium]|nr:hypothetical protein [bacterium]